mmetsp:Transcript_11751/g.23713  ORF Transcript_11751/g.23713 Transcript_11751/m.23713 type:complete len:105 (-) Transcript_11751:123-437(-)
MKLALTILAAFASTTTAFNNGFLFTELQSAQIDQVLADCKTEHKIDGAECGELCINSSIAYLAEKFGGVTPGDCKSEGYTVFDHTETVSMGPLGDAEVTIYTKP